MPCNVCLCSHSHTKLYCYSKAQHLLWSSLVALLWCQMCVSTTLEFPPTTIMLAASCINMMSAVQTSLACNIPLIRNCCKQVQHDNAKRHVFLLTVWSLLECSLLWRHAWQPQHLILALDWCWMRLCSEEKLLCNQTALTARTHWDKLLSRLATPCRIACLRCGGSQQIAAMVLLHTSKFTCLGPLYAARRREWQIPSVAEQAHQFKLMTCLQKNTREHWIIKQPVVVDTLLLTHEWALSEPLLHAWTYVLSCLTVDPHESTWSEQHYICKSW